jgi:hypothetical protein
LSNGNPYAGLLQVLAGPPPQTAADPAGTLTPEGIGRALDEMWNEGARRQLPCDSGCACCEPPVETDRPEGGR